MIVLASLYRNILKISAEIFPPTPDFVESQKFQEGLQKEFEDAPSNEGPAMGSCASVCALCSIAEFLTWCENQLSIWEGC